MSEAVLPLSPVDHVFTGVGSNPIEFAFAYQGTIDPVGLRRSLDQTLEAFWPLCTNLTRISEHSYGFQPAGDGLTFETSHCSEVLEDVGDVSCFVDSVHSIEGEPLTRIKLTQTPLGSVLGVSISHALVDGFSFFHFLSSWSRNFKGQRILNPCCDREVLRPEMPESPVAVTPGEVLDRCGLFWVGERPALLREEVHEERLVMPKESMNRLLQEVEGDCDVPLFHNDSLTAYLWRRLLTQWDGSEGHATASVTCPVDFRRILRGVPRTYLGNALCFVSASIDRERLASAPLGELAGLVRGAVGRARQEYVSGSLQTLERLRQQEGLAVMEKLHVVPPQHGILVTNISRLPIQSLDFGLGPPVAFRALGAAQRAAAILPAEDGVEIRVFHSSSQ